MIFVFSAPFGSDDTATGLEPGTRGRLSGALEWTVIIRCRCRPGRLIRACSPSWGFTPSRVKRMFSMMRGKTE